MRAILALTALSLVSAAQLDTQEAPQLKVAVVRLDRLMNNEYGSFDRMRPLLADKDVVKALKKIDAEIKAVQKATLNAEDEIQLVDLEKRMNLLNRKSNLLRQRGNPDAARDAQKLVREFVVKTYHDKYQMIAQDSSVFDRFVYKGNVEITDITEDAVAKFEDYLDKALDE